MSTKPARTGPAKGGSIGFGVDANASMTWRSYAGAFLLFNALGPLAVYALLDYKISCPWNPQALARLRRTLRSTSRSVSPPIRTGKTMEARRRSAISRRWRPDRSELCLRRFRHGGSSGVGARARVPQYRQNRQLLGGPGRSTVYILLPLSVMLTLLLVSQGVIQNLDPYVPVADSKQLLPMGPAASQIAIKQLGTNGGGFFNVNSAHPFENPTPLSNFAQMLAILLIPAALCYAFGRMVNDRRQGWALLAAMLVLFVPLLLVTVHSEQSNMEGKEVRFGTANSAIWAVATTAASNGSVNSMHDSFTPMGGFVTLFLMQMGEVVFGGVGSGLYGMIVFAIIAVFLAGLMVGRTPEYLGKKIEAFEMKMASVAILVPPLCVLVGTAIAVVTPMGLSGMQNRGPMALAKSSTHSRRWATTTAAPSQATGPTIRWSISQAE